MRRVHSCVRGGQLGKEITETRALEIPRDGFGLEEGADGNVRSRGGNAQGEIALISLSASSRMSLTWHSHVPDMALASL